MARSETSNKTISVLLDLSGSMYRFNQYDGRLDKLLSTSLLLIEAFNQVPSSGGNNASAPLTFE
jgi:hypothetical protein